MAVGGLQQVFQLGLLGGKRIEIGVRLGVGGVDFFQPLLGILDMLQSRFDVAAHVLAFVELGFLGEVADVNACLRARLAVDLGVEPGHDAQQCGFSRSVESQHTNLGAGEERQGDVAQDFTLGRHHLADLIHGVDVLGHKLLQGVT
jgi:hypothetical protein